MANPKPSAAEATVEEMALAGRIRDLVYYWICNHPLVGHEKCCADCFAELRDRPAREIDDFVKAAVQAETERCAQLTGWEVRRFPCKTPDCLAQPGESCRPVGQGRSHANRWRAAIRTQGTK